ncbi:PREDICTED: nucleoside diphosphate kinase, mitochondrial-like [Cercocebus atys]|uniref:nucleoside diphosphate kinase, mitochondrial-like n=1 Tax=Cercocebus atys TaxID=9531 RepID=UPI0005F44C12|nr:PREDICTED: nucleoside diphosphate kinase, mitochondrial-like [Cercocebus atys]
MTRCCMSLRGMGVQGGWMLQAACCEVVEITDTSARQATRGPGVTGGFSGHVARGCRCCLWAPAKPSCTPAQEGPPGPWSGPSSLRSQMGPSGGSLGTGSSALRGGFTLVGMKTLQAHSGKTLLPKASEGSSVVPRPGTTWGDFSAHITRNLFQARNSVEGARRRIPLWFPIRDLVSWARRQHSCGHPA